MKTSHKNGFQRAHEHLSQKRETIQHQPGAEPITKLEMIGGIVAAGIIGAAIVTMFYLA